MVASILGRGINQETEQEEEITIGDIERRGGLYVLGRAGTGKSNLLIHLILQDIAHGHGLCFLDPHGDAIQEILKRLTEHRKDDVISLDPLDDTHAFGLNLFACPDPTNKKQVSRTLEYVLQIFAKLFTQSGNLNQEAPYMYETLLNTTILLIYNQNYTLAEVPLILTNEDACTKLIPNIAPAHDDVRQWWLRYNSMKQVDKDQITGSTRRRLQAFLTDEHIRHIVGQRQSTLNFQEITDRRNILLVKLSREFDEVTTLVGSMIIGHLLTTAYGRDSRPDTEETRPHFCIYADEFQHFATPDFAKLFTETRKFHYAATVAHQERVGQFDQHDKNRGATKAAANIVVFRTTIDDAQEFAPEFAKKPPPAEPQMEYKRTPVQEPVSYILSTGRSHPVEAVNTFFSLWRDTYDLAVGHVKETGYTLTSRHYYLRGSSITPYGLDPARVSPFALVDAQRKMREVNSFFYEVMRTKNSSAVFPMEQFYHVIANLQPPCFDCETFILWRNSETPYNHYPPRDYVSTLFELQYGSAKLSRGGEWKVKLRAPIPFSLHEMKSMYDLDPLLWSERTWKLTWLVAHR
jgi:hypothetical protein